MPVTKAQVAALQKRPDCIRNICILAHIDHGKTTLSDSLLASNGIISAKMAGKLRFLDSRPDEQEKGITMEASAVSLFFNVLSSTGSREYLVNLIDSPGHVDFNSEVSTAVRLCDGALVLVDVVEGVSTQTLTVLRQAWIENVRPCLVLNKIDRLITDLKLTPLEAHQHLQHVVERVNAVMGMLFRGDLLEGDSAAADAAAAAASTEADASIALEDRVFDWNLEDKDDSEIYFAPERGNVVFASAMDGWAFTIDQFAHIYAERLGINEGVLRKTLWGEYYLDAKNKRVVGREAGRTKMKPMFVQFVLENIWAIYDAVVTNNDPTRIEKIIGTLHLKVQPREIKSKETRGLLQTIMSQWLPLARSILLMVVRSLPSPVDAQKTRATTIIYGNATEAAARSSELSDESRSIIDSVSSCSDSPTDPTVVFIAKMIAVSPDALPDNRRILLTAEELRERRRLQLLQQQAQPAADSVVILDDASSAPAASAAPQAPTPAARTSDDIFVGFGRVFSGTLRPGQEIFVLGPKYSPLEPTKHVTKVTIDRIFFFMGRDLTDLEEAHAGTIVAISGISEHVVKSATLSSSLACPSFCKLHLQVAPIVRVALEPANPSQMSKLVDGLRLLSQSDPSVEVYVQDTGEHILSTTGELHLERCMTDLRERFAKIEIEQSEPIVAFRETIVEGKRHGADFYGINESGVPAEDKPCNVVVVTPRGAKLKITLRVVPLPAPILAYLLQHAEALRTAVDGLGEQAAIDSLREGLKEAFGEVDATWAALYSQLWALGPKRCGPNVLLSTVPGHTLQWLGRKGAAEEVTEEEPIGGDIVTSSVTLPSTLDTRVESAILSGFQLAMNAGPMCEEPLHGVAVVVESVSAIEAEVESGPTISAGFVSGQILSAMREGIRDGFSACATRLMLAVYSCVIQTSGEVLGKVHAVLAKRRGRVLHEELKEGTDIFVIRAVLPVFESFGFSNEIRGRTSGLAQPQLVFIGFEVFEEDPYWVPTTAEELEDLGEKSDRENVALRYVNLIRKRKGLFVETKIVESAEKQRTMMRK